MAYRRRQQVTRVSTIKEEIGNPYNPPSPPLDESSSASASASVSASASSASSLAAKAIRASSAYRDSSLSSAYSPVSNPLRSSSPPSTEDAPTYEYTSMKNLNEPKQKFWGVLARKAKAILDDDMGQSHETPGRARFQMSDRTGKDQYQSSESRRKTDSPTLQKGLGAIASSLNYIGGTIGNKIEEGLTVVENRTADIIQETRKLQIRKKGSSSVPQDQSSNVSGVRQQPTMQTQTQTDLETQLKASRDVAMAMAAKAKLLLRELKTVKADLAFAKERCAQLEEENRILRVSREKGDNPDDDDLIRLQLETLLAEKARLAQENSVLARENRFLREIVEYHQLTMQDVVYLDENSEEVSEVYPIKVPMGSNMRSRSTSPTPVPFSLPTSMASQDVNLQVNPDALSPPVRPSEAKEASKPVTRLSSLTDLSAEEHLERHEIPFVG